MAESGRICAECGRPVAMFSGITINGARYHAHCWTIDGRLPKPPPATSLGQPPPSVDGHYDRHRLMPAVEAPQLGR
jgi:hypothetical protein